MTNKLNAILASYLHLLFFGNLYRYGIYHPCHIFTPHCLHICDILAKSKLVQIHVFVQCGIKIGHLQVPRASVSKRGLVLSLSYGNHFLFSFSQERLCTQPRFEIEGFWNAEVAYIQCTLVLVNQVISIPCFFSREYTVPPSGKQL